MQLLRCLLSLSVFILAARATYESEVGVVDWHTKLVGVPLYASQLTKPVLRDDLVLTATSNNVLAALNATDGSIGLLAFILRSRDLTLLAVWRSIHDTQDAIMGFKVHDDSVSLVFTSLGVLSLIPPQIYTPSLDPPGPLCASTMYQQATSFMKSDCITLQREKCMTRPLLASR